MDRQSINQLLLYCVAACDGTEIASKQLILKLLIQVKRRKKVDKTTDEKPVTKQVCDLCVCASKCAPLLEIQRNVQL